jgi:hypothetical protein
MPLLINPDDHQAIANLAQGESAFPKIDYNLENQQVNNPNATLAAMRTLIINIGYGHYIQELNWNPPIENNEREIYIREQLEWIHIHIHRLIEIYIQNPDEDILKKIFIWIHLWGGITGRNIFVQNGGFEVNYNSEIYQQGVQLIIEGNYVEASNLLNNINQLNISFITKHIHFWSNGNGPIFDNNISEIVYGKVAHIRKYNDYIIHIDWLIINHYPNLNRQIIERGLFNWSNTEEGKIWRDIRIN